MPDPITALVVGGTTVASGVMQKKAATSAADVQQQAAQGGIDEQRRQFDAMQALLKPYVEAGMPALQQQQAMLGLQGQDAQRASIAGIESGPLMQALSQQGENAILQNASATGGLRGGNVQAALGAYRPQLLNQLIEQQYGRLGGLTQLGQNSAAGVGSAGMNTGANVSALMQQIGAAQSGGILNSAKAMGQVLNLPAQVLGAQYGAGGKLGLGFKF